MVDTVLTLTEDDVGTKIGPANGFLVGLTMTAGPVGTCREFDPAKNAWQSPRLTLRDDGPGIPVYDVDATAVPLTNGVPGAMLTGRFPYKGQLTVGGVPSGGASFSITLSDV
jgi:hypothetical protein